MRDDEFNKIDERKVSDRKRQWDRGIDRKRDRGMEEQKNGRIMGWKESEGQYKGKGEGQREIWGEMV